LAFCLTSHYGRANAEDPQRPNGSAPGAMTKAVKRTKPKAKKKAKKAPNRKR